MRENVNGQVRYVVVKVPRIALRRELNSLSVCAQERRDDTNSSGCNAMQPRHRIVTDSRCFIFPPGEQWW